MNLSDDDINFIKLYKKGLTVKKISEIYNIPYHRIYNKLKKLKVKKRKTIDYYWTPTESDLILIKKLYIEEKRGKQFIALIFKTSWKRIDNILKKMDIPSWTRSDLIVSNYNHNGPTKGFLGKRHTKESKNKISETLLSNDNRISTGSKSFFIKTCVGKVQGKWELAFLQKCLNDGKKLPKIGISIKTPIGLYFPDFEYPEKIIEIKSPFTWDVCRGVQKNPKGYFSDKQYQKIFWVQQNIKQVDIVILKEKEVLSLFKQAINNKDLVLEKIIYKNGKYTKE